MEKSNLMAAGWGGFFGIVVNVLHCDIIGREFKIPQEKGMNPLIPYPGMG